MGGVSPRGGKRPRRGGRRGPHDVVVLARERRTKLSKSLGGGESAGGWKIQFRVRREMTFDGDARKLCEHVAIGLAAFFSEQALKGQRADGSGPLPQVKKATIQLSTARVGTMMGGRSGFMFRNWYIGPQKGGSFVARRSVKPNGSTAGPKPEGVPADGRSIMIRKMLTRSPPIDFQSVKGAAARKIGELLAEHVKAAFPDPTTVEHADETEGTLPEKR